MKTPYKMTGMSFKGESPTKKTINLSKVASKIKSSKFGKSKLGEAVGNLAEKGGKVQEKYVAKKKSLGLSTSGYDATTTDVTEETTPRDYTSEASIDDTVPTTATPEAGVNLERVKAGPVAKRKKKAPTRNYKKGYYKK